MVRKKFDYSLLAVNILKRHFMKEKHSILDQTHAKTATGSG